MNPTESIKSLDDDEKMTLRNSEGHSGQRGGAQMLNVISEAGLYTLLLRSNKEEAKPFRRWVTHEVLPTLRKTGSYTIERPCILLIEVKTLPCFACPFTDFSQELQCYCYTKKVHAFYFLSVFLTLRLPSNKNVSKSAGFHSS